MAQATTTTIERSERLTLVTVEGELDKLTSEAVRADLGAVVGTGQVLVDLAKVRFLDSAGLHVLFRLARDVTRAGGSVGVVVPPQSPLRRLVEITHLAGVAAVCDSVAHGREVLEGVSRPVGTGTGARQEPPS